MRRGAVSQAFEMHPTAPSAPQRRHGCDAPRQVVLLVGMALCLGFAAGRSTSATTATDEVPLMIAQPSSTSLLRALPCLATNITQSPKRLRSVAVSTYETRGVDDEVLPPDKDLPLNVTSSRQCYELPNGTGKVDVLGQLMSTAHYCVLTNVCVERKDLILFDDQLSGQRFRFPRQALLQEKSAVFEPRSAPTAARAILANQKSAPGRRVFRPGTAVLLRHSYCCAHIRHFLEPIPMLHEALRDLTLNVTRRAESVDSHDGRPVVHRLVVVPGSTPSTDLIGWNRLMAEVALVPSYGPPRTNSDGGVADAGELPPLVWAMPLLLSPKREAVALKTRCFERVIMPSSEYSVFRAAAPAAAFREDLYRVLSRLKWAEYRRTNDTRWIANEKLDGSGFEKNSSERVILVSVRKSKRSVWDMPLLVEWIKEFSAPLNVTVKTIEYGGLSVLSQAVHSQEADILVALHGADLTNLVFQRAGAMVIELNPIFFFESGYYEMARALGLRYGAWTCTAPSCAFRGQLDVWGRFLPANKISYNATTGAVVIPSVGSNVSLKWPFKGYAGGCRPCKQILDSDVVRPHFYSALRDSVILVKDHKHELADVFNDAFSQLGWQ